MKRKIFSTSDKNVPALVLRITLALVMFPHGAQKLFGWFGGYGWQGTMDYLTNATGTPALLLVIVFLTESIGMLLLFAGFATRIVSALMVVIMTGAVFVGGHTQFFFMNWFGNQPIEGFEFHLLVIGIAISLLVLGGGKYSVDSRVPAT